VTETDGQRDAQPAPGDAFGPWRLEELIGEGGMGLVFRATHAETGAIAALKLIKPQLASDEEHARRFVREARAAREVRHRNLVGVLDAGDSGGRAWLALEFVPGRPLDVRLRDEGPLAAPDIVRLAAEIGSALDAIHAAGLVHRDVKPANILFDAEGCAQLTDFGLATGADYSVITQAGKVLGTMDYLAPELIRGEPPGPGSDLYALGCVVFECFCGRPPFGGRGMLETGVAHLGEEPADPCADRGDVSRACADAVLMALRKTPAERPRTASDYARMLTLCTRAASG
jgi:eukaryotic-like serine/threonine-protein kinase